MEQRVQQWLRDFWRPGSNDARDVRVDVWWLIGLSLFLLGIGLGLRDPWPADEPRFALIARDMVHSGQWLIPMIGGDTYADKPPLFFWFIATFYALTGSLRAAFLLPSLLAGIGTVLLMYDLGRRLWRRETGLTAALLLLGTVQFVWQPRQAQIDATVCFWIMLGVYGLVRHLLLGPAWRWYCIGFASAGFGIITKGVGFLPILMLIPYFVLRDARWSPRPEINGSWRWALGPLCMLAAICVWFAPMMIASFTSPQLAAYRDEILFQQTIDRYANAWHHVKPFWYFLVEVIPPLWLPASALLPWAIPRWRADWRSGELRSVLLLGWVVLVVTFFSLSTGKRGVYILPALPALCVALAPVLQSLWSRAGVRRVFLSLAAVVAVVCVALAAYAVLKPTMRMEVLSRYGVDPLWPMLCIGVPAVLWVWLMRLRFAALAWAGVLALVLSVTGLWISPAMNPVRSGSAFIRQVEARVPVSLELGLVGYSEQDLLYFRRTTWNFGHARWRQWQQETDDAALWLSSKPERMLLVDEQSRARCFAAVTTTHIQDGNHDDWYLVPNDAAIDAGCIQRGNASAALQYQP